LVAAIGDVYLWFLTVSGRDGRLLVVVQKFGKLSRQRHHRLALDAGLAPGDLRLPVAWVLLALVGSATAAS
jgi:hypothetical protein